MVPRLHPINGNRTTILYSCWLSDCCCWLPCCGWLSDCCWLSDPLLKSSWWQMGEGALKTGQTDWSVSPLTEMTDVFQPIMIRGSGGLHPSNRWKMQRHSSQFNHGWSLTEQQKHDCLDYIIGYIYIMVFGSNWRRQTDGEFAKDWFCNGQLT